MFRKEAGKYLQVLVPLILKMMTNIDEDDKWGQADEVVEDDNERSVTPRCPYRRFWVRFLTVSKFFRLLELEVHVHCTEPCEFNFTFK